ncbi:MAG TPA: glutamate--tRNA ligase family protein, partial [Thermoanaerobaculia bacterium]
LSKRTGAASVEEFRAEGVLPQALYNYMALLGWAPGDDREILTRREMIEIFAVERLNASAAVFDREKLIWVNSQYLSSLPLAEILPHLAPFLAEAGIGNVDSVRLAQALELHRTRAHTLRELAELVVPYFRSPLAYDAGEAAKFLADPALPGHLEALRARFAALPEWTKDALDAALRALAEERGVKAGVLIHPTRMALTAAAKGPPLFDLVEAMGREATDRHLASFLELLRAGAPAPA